MVNSQNGSTVFITYYDYQHFEALVVDLSTVTLFLRSSAEFSDLFNSDFLYGDLSTRPIFFSMEGDFLELGLERSVEEVSIISLLEARLDKGLVSDRGRSLGRALLGVFTGDDPALFTVLIILSGLCKSRAVKDALVFG